VNRSLSILIAMLLSSCSEENPPSNTKLKKSSNSSQPAISSPVHGRQKSEDDLLAVRMLADLSSFSTEEVSELLNRTNGNILSGRFVAEYQNYLASLKDIRSLCAALAGLNAAPYKTFLLQHVFSKSSLVSPENMTALHGLCKNNEEIEQLAIGIEAHLRLLKIENQVAFAQGILDSNVDDIVSARIIKASIESLAQADPAKAEDWIFNLPPEVATKADGALLAQYAASKPERGVDYINNLLKKGQLERSKNAVRSFGLNYSKVDPTGAFEWANGLPDVFDQYKVQILVSSFGNIVNTNPNKAKERFTAVKNQDARVAIQSLYNAVLK